MSGRHPGGGVLSYEGERRPRRGHRQKRRKRNFWWGVRVFVKDNVQVEESRGESGLRRLSLVVHCIFLNLRLGSGALLDQKLSQATAKGINGLGQIWLKDVVESDLFFYLDQHCFEVIVGRREAMNPSRIAVGIAYSSARLT